ncbi:MAG: hypothetical protein ACPGWM_02985 [Flavobacteriales bacterium]
MKSTFSLLIPLLLCYSCVQQKNQSSPYERKNQTPVNLLGTWKPIDDNFKDVFTYREEIDSVLIEPTSFLVYLDSCEHPHRFYIRDNEIGGNRLSLVDFRISTLSTDFMYWIKNDTLILSWFNFRTGDTTRYEKAYLVR